MELTPAPMDLVGKNVKKEFEGFGLYSGVVKAYDSSSGFFQIEYEDGDSEELDFSEVSVLLEGEVQPIKERFRHGRKPKKRQRVENKHQVDDEAGNAGDISVGIKLNHCQTLEMGLEQDVSCSSENVEETCGFNLNDRCGENVTTLSWVGKGKGKVEADLNLNINSNCRDVVENGVGDGCRIVTNLEGKLAVGNFSDGFDMNVRLNLKEGSNTNFAIDLPVSSRGSLNSKRRDIDLNLNVNGDNDEDLDGAAHMCSSADGIERKQCDFDLNMECDDGLIYAQDGRVGEDEATTSVVIVEESPNRHGGSLKENCIGGGSTNETLQEVPLVIIEDEAVESAGIRSDKVFGDESKMLAEQMRNDCSASDGDLTANIFVASDANINDNGNLVKIEMKDCLSDSYGKQCSGRRKRRKLSSDLIYTSERVLRRSTRNGSSQNHILLTPFADDDRSKSPFVSAVIEEKQLTPSCKGFENSSNLAVRLDLPPSSKNLNLDDISIIDLFSIYACLRSFSTLLFLSPFELEDFVAALKCKTPCTLFNYIHVSVLQVLRKHLEYLSSEGSESASNCHRSLKWDFLDLITWPMFMVEYLVIHGSGLRPGFDLSQLNLFQSDYCKQSTPLKVEILRCLCDDMLEAESIRSEINRRSLASESETVLDRSTKFEVYKKRKSVVDVSGSSCLTDDILDDTTDWNSDECCLCKMDGRLICCDGCPAAYHTKCVGIVNDLLPDGDWYCPECTIDRSDSCNLESSFHYYHKNDLHGVIEALRSSHIWYSGIMIAIYKHWDIPFSFNREELKLASVKPAAFSKKILIEDYPAPCISTEPMAVTSLSFFEKESNDEKLEDNSVAGVYGNFDVAGAKSMVDSMTHTEDHSIRLEESALIDQVGAENLPNEKPGIIPSGEVSSLAPPCLDGGQEMNTKSTDHEHNLSAITISREKTPMEEKRINYVNLCHFAQRASSVAELISIPSGKTNDNTFMSEEEITTSQIKAILNRTTKFCWPIIHHLDVAVQKEKCGWCYNCKSSDEDRDCLFNMNVGRMFEDVKIDEASHLSKTNGNGHLQYVVYKLLSMEDRLQGLLLGPWLNPQRTNIWRESIFKAPDLTSVKHFLLTLEANLHHRAISAEWSKHIDSMVTLGSALHVINTSLRASSKHGFGRKKGKYSDIDSNSSSNAFSGLGMLWWRGGKLSRRMFNWKVLPSCMASRAARQAGCSKIQDILYLEGSESAKRSRCITWRAAVEASTSVEQLALQIRELDSNIKWDDIENTHPLHILDMESRKSIRLFKKVIIRRKCMEHNIVKYLLDFGKRRAVPDVVKKHGITIEEASREKKRYWLEETYVPLHLLKNFEEKRIARKSSEVKSRKAFESCREDLKSFTKKGFAYLFTRAAKTEFYQCGHCNKDISIREAVTCHSCKGFFHRRHVGKSSGSIIDEFTYICRKCSNGLYVKNAKIMKIDMKGVKVKLARDKEANSEYSLLRLKNKKKTSRVGRPLKSHSNKKTPAGVPLRRSTRKVKCLSVQNKRQYRKVRPKKVRKILSKKGSSRKKKRGITWQKKRTQAYHSYWLNGLHLSRKTNDGRVMQFREKILLASSQYSAILDQPKCHLCLEQGYSPTFNYVACEICGGWFHGDAFGLDSNKIDNLIGFRCHLCRKRDPPLCLIG